MMSCSLVMIVRGLEGYWVLSFEVVQVGAVEHEGSGFLRNLVNHLLVYIVLYVQYQSF